MVKTLEQINLEFFSEVTDLNTEGASDHTFAEKGGPGGYEPSNVRSLDDIRKAAGISDRGERPDPEPKKKPGPEPGPGKRPGGKTAAKRLSDIGFYVVIALILIVTLAYGGKAHDGFRLLGYKGFTVMSGSMQREIPEGSLVITKEVEPADIKVGDDITFIRDDNYTVTHRVIDITEDYEGSGGRGFQTIGIENPEPDRDVVRASNVIGLVKFSIPELGYTLKYISENQVIVFALLSGVLVATIALGAAFGKREERF